MTICSPAKILLVQALIFPLIARANIEVNIADIFKNGFAPSIYLAKTYQKLKAIQDGYDASSEPDRIHCFTPTTTLWNLPFILNTTSPSVGHNAQESYPVEQDPYNDWPASYFKNSDDARCAKYKIETYSGDPSTMAEIQSVVAPNEYKSGYVVQMPAILKTKLIKQQILDLYLPEITKIRAGSIENLTQIIRDKEASLLERSIAIAVHNILQQKLTLNPFTIEKALMDDKNYFKAHDNSLKYLGYLVAIWLNSPNSHLDVYHDFDLEVRVQDRTDFAIRTALRALNQANNVSAQLDDHETSDLIQSAAYWSGIGILYIRQRPK